jgi:hypothetical protein
MLMRSGFGSEKFFWIHANLEREESIMHGERSVFVAVGMVGLCAAGALGQVEVFINDFDGWSSATGAISTIDFETLPDGSPSDSSVEINSLLNYTNQGATFSSPFDDLIIAGNTTTGFSLISLDGGTLENPTHIRADLVAPALSVGFFFGGNAIFEAFDEEGGILASEFFGSSGSGFFLGIASDIPIGHVIMDRSTISGIESFHFAAVPEPGTVGLLAVGGLGLFRRRGRRDGSGVGRGNETADERR